VSILARLRVDPYILALLATVALASVLPVKGTATARFNDATTIAIGLLFFLYGARLSTKEAVDGLRQWRLHSVVLASTYLLFPLLGLAARALVPSVLSPELCAGVMFLCCLPSTVQSSIAFTSIARGNVAAAICSASFSNLIGIVLTPSLVALFLFTSGGGISFGLVVYTAFSGGVVAGIWSSGKVSPGSPRRVGAHRRTSQVRPGDLAASSAGPVASQPRPWSS
jgi:solute carrier family 10 (sodium/bile acid cotransporter), member 7